MDAKNNLIKQRIACFALISITVLLCFTGCASKDSDLTITADKYERELYTDETAITLNVIAPGDVSEISVSQLGGAPDIYGDWVNEGSEKVFKNLESDPLFYTEVRNTLSFTADNAEVSVGDKSKTWTICVDFGNDGVYGLNITAARDNGKQISQKVPVYVRYPEINIINDGVCAAWEAYILRDSDEPFYFVTDLSKTDLDYKSVDEITFWGNYKIYNGWNAMFCADYFFERDHYENLFGFPAKDPWEIKFESDSAVYGEFLLWDSVPFTLNINSRSFAGEFTSVFGIDNMTFPTGAVILSQIEETDEERITPSARAAVCYLKGGSVNAEIYPEAAVCFNRANEVLADIIKPGMTDFEKAKAIHDWMYSYAKNINRGTEWDYLDAVQRNDLLKSAYGFMSGYGGDCLGWSDTFYMLCSMAGIKCSTVSALAEPGGPASGGYTANHQFNVAMLDGEIYYFDVYWDAAGSAYEGAPYKYFCMTTAKAAQSHTWASPEIQGPPIADSETYAVDEYTGELLNK